MRGYRDRIFSEIRRLVEPIGPFDKILDFGAGDGFYASRWKPIEAVRSVTAIDVVRRKMSFVAPLIYDGGILPFADGSFDLIYAVDVLHHCANPKDSLNELMRCSRGYLLIKDHSYLNWLGKLALGIMDEIGNRRFGIPSPHRYQRDWEWLGWIEAAGWRRLALIHPLNCHVGLLGKMSNRLQFIGLWERIDA